MKSRTFIALLTSVALAEMAGIAGAFFTFDAVGTWYAALAKPLFNPPNWIFGPVWTTLYALMGIAAWRIYERRFLHDAARPLLALYLVHLAVNALWSIAFFTLQNPELALAVIAVLWVLIAYLTLRFYRIDRTAGYLLIPYLAWVTFASYLNLSIALLN